MTELTREADLAAPEFEVQAGEVMVRFRPSSYVPPSKIGHSLSPLQEELLSVLSDAGPASLANIRSCIRSDVAGRTIQENLAMLRTLGLADSSGRGRGARWMLKGREQ
jgi:ATP-dependent DNA helicase RecG